MVRNGMVLSSVLAFTLPLALPQSSSARPLTAPAPEIGFCWGDGCPDKEDGDDPIELDLLLCVEAEIKIVPRSCEVLQGPACEEQCTFAAVGPGCLAELSYRPEPRELRACAAERIELCRSQCADGGAAFCEGDALELQARGHEDGGPPGLALGHCNEKNPHYDAKKCGKAPHKPDKGEHDGDGGTVVFIDIEGCIELDIDIDKTP